MSVATDGFSAMIKALPISNDFYTLTLPLANFVQVAGKWLKVVKLSKDSL
jgi:hypothetical protein